MSDASKKIPAAKEENGSENQNNKTVEETGYIEPDLLNELPPEIRKVIEISGMAMGRVGPMPNPLTGKINEKHIDKILELAEKDEERSFKDAAESRKFVLIYVLIFAALFIFSTIFLVNTDKDLYREVIKLFAVFLGGLGGGFGIKSYLDRKK